MARPEARPGAAGDPDGRDAIAFHTAVFDWCVRRARRCREREALEQALQWLEIAGRHAVDHPFGALSSPGLEAELLEIARALPACAPPGDGQPPRGAGDERARPRWLHVFTQVYEIGGHTAMAARWFGCDRARRHDAVLLSQPQPPPDFFVSALRAGGGQLWQLAPGLPLLERARALRTRASAETDVVVLHVHPWDVVPTVAFGVSGGPAVVVVNHAGHAFWIGGAVADLVLSLRRASQEWTERHRGIPRGELLPILVPTEEIGPVGAGSTAESRARARDRLGVPRDSVVLVTVARAEKFTALPGGGADFLDAAESILRGSPRAWLLAVGPTADPRWDAARRAVEGRLRAEGAHRDLADYYAAVDVFLESFPFGSSTALLEAAIRGIPCVRAPRSLPPFGSGGPGIEGLPQPEDAAAYAREALALLEDETARRDRGRVVAAAVRACHGTTGWLARLDEVATRIPANHVVHPLPAGERLPPAAVASWAKWSSAVRPGNALVAVFEAALAGSLEPSMDGRLLAVTLRRPRPCDDQGLAAACLVGLALRLPWPRHITPERIYRWTRYLGRPWGRLRRVASRVAGFGRS